MGRPTRRRQALAAAGRGRGRPVCALWSPDRAGTAWHLDHRDDGLGCLGVSHALCNLKAAARLENARMREKKGARGSGAAGVPHFSPHDLRHRRVSLLQLARMPWARIGELVGHDDLVTTARTYTHLVADEGEIDYEAVLQ
jgi:integrase